MQYFITFLEGVISFISPCMLPMLPLYVSYFAGGADKKRRILLHALAFVLGFTLIFMILGLMAGTMGTVLLKYRTAVNVVTGLLVVLFGLNYLEIVRLPFFKGIQGGREVTGVVSAFLFGMVYSLSLTPCVGAFLGSALMLASSAGGALQGTMLLLTYSAGLGIPFLLSAVLLDRLQETFRVVKKHYKVINTVCGIFLILLGILMMFGWMNAMLTVFA
ncbi:MAG: cytochrome c biogenesis protein CcdA [Lachnospiraceae bacterium]|nr:cytochrome c biogenesis protein CcdA [Lachnospiraceae bacterium]